MGKYTEYDKASMSVAWRVVLWIIAFLTVAGVIGFVVLAVRSATSEARGALDAQVQINDGTNQIQSQELFQVLYAKVKEYDKNLDPAAQAVKDDPSSFNKTNLTGLIMTCNAAVEEYNAEAAKVSSAKWRSPDLPYQIDETDPTTDCKENEK